MEDHDLKANDLVNIIDLSKGIASKILNYQKGLAKEVIRKLSIFFKLTQEAFNRPYELANEVNRNFTLARLKGKQKTIEKV